jgi:hypothetical protein
MDMDVDMEVAMMSLYRTTILYVAIFDNFDIYFDGNSHEMVPLPGTSHQFRFAWQRHGLIGLGWANSSNRFLNARIPDCPASS